ncbi:MAG: YggS family pyridoxal phosphate-dependent enzyme [Candidatus Aminicenantes bacterium]|nr:YggS family pyridoxal phosphate-dependent enzyme [Candidatus Aminicenantes bacterium]RLE02143.1 MAG: YggS family pyridoxal phosphate-dependent enzyme [Candidatus Aminicenantes bacterium]
MSQITKNVKKILAELPPGVELEAAAKGRSPQEILEAIEAGVKIIGENYVQEALVAYQVIGARAKWHFIGHLQRNKVKKAIEIFDMIETLDSLPLAEEIEKRCRLKGKVMPVLIEVNSGREPQKYGVLPEEVEDFVRQITDFSHLQVLGLMTMGPAFGDPEEARPYFQETRRLFERLKSLALPGVEMKYLSMGMSNSYRVAIEEGANLVRLGTILFGPREY